jgi:hypothetical protein
MVGAVLVPPEDERESFSGDESTAAKRADAGIPTGPDSGSIHCG